MGNPQPINNMALGRHFQKTEGGHKRGHSQMNHWEPTEIIKAKTRRLRRIQGKRVVEQAAMDGRADSDMNHDTVTR